MATLFNLQLRAIEATDHERKITELQRQVAETKEKGEFKDAEPA
jgi:hypothetical protein